MGLSVGGLGSNLPVDDLVTKLMSVEKLPLQKLELKEVNLNAKVASLNQVKGALGTFQSAVRNLTDPARFMAVSTTSSDSSIATASTSSNKVATGSFAVEVTQLASSQRLVTQSGYASSKTVVGGGTLTFNFGETNGTTFTDNPDRAARAVTIAQNATLEDIRDAVNKANIGVSANIINDGINGYRLVYSVADTGAKNSLKITASGDGGALSALTYDPADGVAAKMTQLQAATNAKFKMDGIEIEKASNTVSDAVDGVTFSLKKVGTATLGVNRDTATVKKSVEDFVKAYNELNKTLGDVSALDTTEPKPGEQRKGSPLSGEVVIRSIKNQLRSAFNTVATGLSGDVRLPADVGISFSRTGVLQLDSTRLQEALMDDPQAVAALFGATARTTDNRVGYVSASSATQVGTYAVEISAMTYGVVQGTAPTLPAAPGSFDITIDGVARSGLTLPSGSYSSATTLAADLQTTINRAFSGVTGTAPTYPVDQTTPTAFSLTVDGVTKSNLTLAAGSYADAGELATAMQSTLDTAFGSNKVVVEQDNGALKIRSLGSSNAAAVTVGAGLEFAGFTTGQTDANRPSVAVSVDAASGGIQIASNRKGSASSVTVVSGLAGVGLADGTTNTGTASVVGMIGGYAATGNGLKLVGDVGTPVEGLTLEVTGGATGSRGEVNFTRGFAWALDKALSDLQSFSGAISSRTQGINSSLKQISRQKTALNRRLEDTEVRLRRQFNAMDEAVSKLTSLGNYITQQMTAFQNSND